MIGCNGCTVLQHEYDWTSLTEKPVTMMHEWGRWCQGSAWSSTMLYIRFLDHTLAVSLSTFKPPCFISSRLFPGIPGASQQHHPLPGPDSHAALQSSRKSTTIHPLAEEWCPCGPGTGTHNYPQDRGRIQAPHPGLGHNRHGLLSVRRLQLTQSHLSHRRPVCQTR